MKLFTSETKRQSRKEIKKGKDRPVDDFNVRDRKRDYEKETDSQRFKDRPVSDVDIRESEPTKTGQRDRKSETKRQTC